MEDKRLALISVTDVHNYGTILQTYALQEIINRNGFNGTLICYSHRELSKQIVRIFNWNLLFIKIKQIQKRLKLIKETSYLNYIIQREYAFKDFINVYLKLSPEIKNRKKLKSFIKQFQCVVLGSDQVWNPVNLGRDYYTLSFVPDKVVKIAYAPSFGVKSIPFCQKRKTKTYLDRIQFLSVREETGRNIIQELTGKKALVVADPTLLLTRNEWESLENPVPNLPPDYIFCYFLGNAQENRKFADRIKLVTGYAIVHLPFLDEFVEADKRFGDIFPLGIGPREFLYLIHHAKIVCTDSFHGTVFSLIFQKQFYSMSRTGRESKMSTSSRVQDLLKECSMSEFYYDGKRRLEHTPANYKENTEKGRNWIETQEKIRAYRKISLEFLIGSIERAGGWGK